MNIMICGSRYNNTQVKEKLDLILLNILLNSFNVICGDAYGIDKLVIDLIDEMNTGAVLGVKKIDLLVVGANNTLRNKSTTGINITVPFSYTLRDDFMLNNAEKVFCFWNGESKGTKRNYDKAVALNKIAYLYTKDGLITNKEQITQSENRIF